MTACQNTDQRLWAKDTSAFSPSIFLTQEDGIGISCQGLVVVQSIEKWHEAGRLIFNGIENGGWLARLAIWILRRNFEKIKRTWIK